MPGQAIRTSSSRLFSSETHHETIIFTKTSAFAVTLAPSGLVVLMRDNALAMAERYDGQAAPR